MHDSKPGIGFILSSNTPRLVSFEVLIQIFCDKHPWGTGFVDFLSAGYQKLYEKITITVADPVRRGCTSKE